MDKYIGRLLDNRYEILEVIGTGGMAVVYKARCHRLNRLVAIKILKDEYSLDDEFRRRFHAESQAVAMLSHPNIVSVYDVSATAGADFIVMELIDGITLKQYMEKKGVLNWKETLHFAMQIGKALEHAHSRGIVHRDIKPHNVMVLKNGSVKVADFGIARVMSKSNTLTKEALGSVHYISPEQAKGGRVDNRSDLYSLGVVMYEMMTGRPPYDGESPVAVAIQHINGGAPMPSTLNPNIPGGLEQIICKAMSIDPNKRYSSATEMLNDMDEFRKNPSILFDYSNTPVDDALRLQSQQAASQNPVQPRPQQPVSGIRQAPGARPVGQRPAGGSYAQKNSAAARKRRDEELEAEEKRSRITTIAVVSCSVVLIVAILITCGAIFGSCSPEAPPELVLVPSFEGKYYEDIAKQTYEGFSVIRKAVYDDQVPRDQVIRQEPAAGSEIVAGNQVILTVSLGPEPREKVMEDLAGLTEENARKFLADLKLDLVILPKQEPSTTVPYGSVTRTEPETKEPLTIGQTVILWISTGPEVVEEQMPRLVGLKYSTAVDMLNRYGFKNVDYIPVESAYPKDQVVGQSVKKGEIIDVNTKIYLEISMGTTATTEPTTEPTTAPPTTEAPTTAPTEPSTQPPTEAATEETSKPTENQTFAKQVRLELPKDKTEAYVISLRQDGKSVIPDLEVQPGTTSVLVELSGSGVQTYQLYIDNVYYTDVVVEFAIDG